MNAFKMALAALTLCFGLTVISESAEAARLGGGRSIGTQRPIAQKQATTPAQQAAPATTAQPQPAAGNRWLGPIAGLAAGLGLGYLFANGGLGGMMGPILLAMLAAFAVMMLVRMFARQRMAPAGAGSTPPMQYSSLGNETVAAPPPSQIPGAEAKWGDNRPQQPSIPPGFDAAGFLKQSKLNFIRIQEANDHADLDALREVTTEEMYEKLASDIRHRTGAQHTDVVTLEAALLEVVTENDAHWASVRFSGQIRETAGAAPTPFSEVWHLRKPVSGEAGWLIAGIEQIS